MINVPHVLERNVHSVTLRWDSPYNSNLIKLIDRIVRSYILLIFSLLHLSLMNKGVLTFPNIVVDLSISSVPSVISSLTLQLVRCTHEYRYYGFFYHYTMSLFSLDNILSLSESNVAKLALFLLLITFRMLYLLPSLYF